MILKRCAVSLLIGCLLAGIAAASNASQTPLNTVKERIDQIITILNDPTYKTPGQKGTQRDKIWEISQPMFDFQEISRRTVGPKWDIFSETEKEQFTTVFAAFLGNTYIDKIQGEYHNEQIVYLKELVKEPLALVRTKLVRESVEIPIDYRMRWNDSQWKIYDILVENGVSLVQNYRVQFRSILEKEPPAELIRRLEEKLREQKQTVQ
jgi:phospholipid transport system substrate-binding protein